MTIHRAVVHTVLSRLGRDRLVVHEVTPGRADWQGVFEGGGAPPTDSVPLAATVTVHDMRAYSAVMRQGSVGLGRGYLEGWWSSDDPVTVVRILIRNMSALDRWRNRAQRIASPVSDRIRLARPRNTRHSNKADIAAHYDLGNEFFALFLDETMTYSSGVFASPDSTLADASRHKYDLLLDSLGVADQHHLLEIGSGWGGMAIRAAERSQCKVTTATISAEQLNEAQRRVRAAGFDDRVEVIDRDWRDLDGTYDRIVSIEMIEAVDWRDYDEFFATIARCLAPGGRVAIQAICVPDELWERAKNTEDFIKHYVFPNGFLPSLAAIRASLGRVSRLRMVEVNDITPHYAETLLRWRQQFMNRLDDVAQLGFDDRFCRLWEFYLAYCEAGFRERHVTVAQLTLT
jgi:cyclopropane-fatty-acyl-phospholipid synthase